MSPSHVDWVAIALLIVVMGLAITTIRERMRVNRNMLTRVKREQRRTE